MEVLFPELRDSSEIHFKYPIEFVDDSDNLISKFKNLSKYSPFASSMLALTNSEPNTTMETLAADPLDKLAELMGIPYGFKNGIGVKNSPLTPATYPLNYLAQNARPAGALLAEALLPLGYMKGSQGIGKLIKSLGELSPEEMLVRKTARMQEWGTKISEAQKPVTTLEDALKKFTKVQQEDELKSQRLLEGVKKITAQSAPEDEAKLNTLRRMRNTW